MIKPFLPLLQFRTQADIESDAKLYAAMYPDRVRRIHAARGLPPDIDFGPPEPEIVAALLRTAGISPGATHLDASTVDRRTIPQHREVRP